MPACIHMFAVSQLRAQSAKINPAECEKRLRYWLDFAIWIRPEITLLRDEIRTYPQLVDRVLPVLEFH